jgi:hypothetical protein
MVAPSCFKASREIQPAEPSPQRTQLSNATARLGLPNKPAPRRTSEQKRADEEQAKEAKEAKKLALKGAYQRISSMQARMANEQTDADRNRAPMHPKSCAIKKSQSEFPGPAILGPRYPREYCELYGLAN